MKCSHVASYLRGPVTVMIFCDDSFTIVGAESDDQEPTNTELDAMTNWGAVDGWELIDPQRILRDALAA